MPFNVPLSCVEQTAIDAAWLRAVESRRVDRLFDDPYAAVFAASAPGVIPREVPDEHAALLEATRLQVVVRTRFFDDYLLHACADGLRQAVLLGAGLDTRAFRLVLPDGVRLFELDLPEVLCLKASVLADHAAVPRCERTIIPIDLRTNWSAALRAAGFAPEAATAWLAEGLFVYLSTDDVTRLLGVASELSAPSSRIAFEYGIAGSPPTADEASDGGHDAARTEARTEVHDGARTEACPTSPLDRLAALWKGGPYVYLNASDQLVRHGWHFRTQSAAGFAASCGRAVGEHAIGGFLTAVRDPAPVRGTWRPVSTTSIDVRTSVRRRC
jgi:methyltransferase (TIGR00027 family)